LQFAKEREILFADRITNEKKREEAIYAIRLSYLSSEIQAIEIALKEQLELREQQYLNDISQANLTAEKKAEIEAQYQADVVQLNQDAQRQVDQLNEEVTIKTAETLEERLSIMAQKWLDFYSNIAATVQETLNTIQMAFDLAFDNQTRKIEESYNAQVEAAKDAYGEQLISREEYDNQIEQIENQKAQKERALRKKQFDQQKAFNIVNAVMSGAQSVLQALASMPPPLSYVMAAINAALAGVQIGIISSQKFTASRGGVVPGAGPSAVDSVDAKLAPGEMVINANSASMFPTLISEINKAGGGIPLAPEPVGTGQGGSNTFQASQSVVRAYVVESELSSTSRRVRRMEDAASF
jgi:hypothetical protein